MVVKSEIKMNSYFWHVSMGGESIKYRGFQRLVSKMK